MGFSFGNAIAAVRDEPTRACLMRLGAEMGTSVSTLSTLVRNNVSTSTIVAGAGLTGGGAVGTGTTTTLDVGAGFGIAVAADSVAVNQGMVPTWTGVHTFSATDVHNAGVDLGTSGRLDSHVVDGAGVSSFLYKPSVPLTSSATRYIHHFQDSSGNTGLVMKSDGTWGFGDDTTVGGFISVGAVRAEPLGILFQPPNTGAGTTVGFPATNIVNTIAGGQFKGLGFTGGTFTSSFGGIFGGEGNVAGVAYVNLFGGAFYGRSSAGASLTNAGGWKVYANSSARGQVKPTNWYGGYVEKTNLATNAFGLYLEEQTAGSTSNYGIFAASATGGRKLYVVGDSTTWIAWENTGIGSLNGTTWDCKADFDISAKNVVTDTSTGTKIGTGTTQKLGFWNAAPAAQPATGGAASTFVANTSGIVDDSGTWDGYTVGNVVKALRNMGLLA